MSPNCSDIEFRPKTILSRPGLGLRFTDESAFTGLKSFYGIDRVRRLATLQANGALCVEAPEGQLNRIQHLLTNNATMKAVYAFGRLWMCFSDGKRPLDFPTVYDPVPTALAPYQIGPMNPSAPTVAATAADNAVAGLITAGLHYFFYTWEDKYGGITQMSPIGSWTAAGSKKADFSGVLLGPLGLFGATTRARIWMTPAYVTGQGVAGFFNNGALTIENGLTTVTVSITDATLQTGTIWATDNLTLVPPPPAIGVVRFADRLVLWGVYNGIEPRLAQREDGLGSDLVLLGRPAVDFSTLTGWTTDSGTMAITTQSTIYGSVGTRTGAVLSVNDGHVHKDFTNILASSYQDNQYWLKPGQRYGFLVRMGAAGTSASPVTISMIAQSTTTTLATATITVPLNANTQLRGPFAIYEVDAVAAVPSGETTIRFDISSGGAAGPRIDWIRPYLQASKFDGSTVWVGDNLIPTNFDLVKSPLPVAPGDWQEIRCCFEQTGNLYVVKEHSTWVTADNGQDPNTWNIDNVSFEMGTPSIHGVGIGPEFAIIAGREGVYRFDSGGIQKISQEIETTWQGIDWTQGHLLWVTVDPALKVIRVAVPLKTGPAGVCNIILKCDYTEGWNEGWTSDADQVLTAGARKWSIDNVATICGEMAEKDDGSRNLLVGGSSASSNNLDCFVFDSPFTQVGTRAKSATYFQVQPVGQYMSVNTQQGEAWSFPFSSGTARYKAQDGVVPPLGGYFVASFWAQSSTPSVNVPATIRDPFGIADVSITIKPSWQRFVASFGPNPTAGTVQEAIDLDFGTLTAPISVNLFGAQLQSGQFDRGWTGQRYNTAENHTGAGLASGFLSEPIVYAPGAVPPWKTQDWNGAITPTYEFAPFGAPLGRSNFNKIIARVRGSGQLAAYWVQPDNNVTALNNGIFPRMSTNPIHDVEMGGQAQGTFIGVRLSTSGISDWFSLKKFGIFSRGHEGAPLRGKS